MSIDEDGSFFLMLTEIATIRRRTKRKRKAA
jgi:hypothetical protein